MAYHPASFLISYVCSFFFLFFFVFFGCYSIPPAILNWSSKEKAARLKIWKLIYVTNI